MIDLDVGTVHLGGSGSNAKFYFNEAGDLSITGSITAESSTITGNIYADNIVTNSGSIGGWTIDQDSIFSGSTIYGSTNTGETSIRLWGSDSAIVNNAAAYSDKTKLKGLGIQFKQNAVLNGSQPQGFIQFGEILANGSGDFTNGTGGIGNGWMGIQAADTDANKVHFQLGFGGASTEINHSIAGWKFDEGKLSTGTGTSFVSIDSTNQKIRLGAKSSLTDANGGVHLGTDGIAIGPNSAFKVTADGAASASNLLITGDSVFGGTLVADTRMGLPHSGSLFFHHLLNASGALHGAYGNAVNGIDIPNTANSYAIGSTYGINSNWISGSDVITGVALQLDGGPVEPSHVRWEDVYIGHHITAMVWAKNYGSSSFGHDTNEMAFSIKADNPQTAFSGMPAIEDGQHGNPGGSAVNLYFTGQHLCWNTGDGADNRFYAHPDNQIGLPYPGSLVNSHPRLKSDKWRHWCVDNNPLTGTASLYVDGEIAGWAKYRNTFTDQDEVTLGGYGNDFNYCWTGALADLRIYSGSLEASQIKALSNNPGNVPPSTTNISGDRIKTGIITSTNWTGTTGVKGTLFDLNEGKLQIRSGSQDYFHLDPSGNKAEIAGWTFNQQKFYSNPANEVRGININKDLGIRGRNASQPFALSASQAGGGGASTTGNYNFNTAIQAEAETTADAK